MLALSVERVGEVAVVECEGVVTQNESAYKLHDAITSLQDAQIIVLDLSEITMIGNTGLTTFLILQHWAEQHRIQFKLFNPRWWVREELEHTIPISGFDFVSLPEIMAILANAEGGCALAG
jgi:anti-anti-sigma regulatory factor